MRKRKLFIPAIVVKIVAKRKKRSYANIIEIPVTSKEDPSQTKSVDTLKPSKKEVISAPLIKEPTITGPISLVSEPQSSFSNVISDKEGLTDDEQKWFIVGATAIGKSHKKDSKVCQDNHRSESIGNGWGIAITCDGAGSAENSHLGSAHVANEIGIAYFKRLVVKNGWHVQNSLPTAEQWALAAREGFKQIYNSLEKLANVKEVNINSLACTGIIVIYSPVGLLVTHIGDGRSGFMNEAGEWKPMIIPHKGEEANHTIFITSKRWMEDSEFKMSGVSVPASYVIEEKPSAFTLMTDGCETHSFQCSVMNQTTQTWNDPNLPYPKFFNPLLSNLKQMSKSGLSSEEANDKWRKFVEGGNEGLREEPDDKTMILGVIV